MDKYVELTAQVISQFVTTQRVAPDQLGELISNTYKALWDAGNPLPTPEPEVQQKRRTRGPNKVKPVVAETQEDDAGETPEVEAILEEDGVDGETGYKQPEPMFDD